VERQKQADRILALLQAKEHCTYPWVELPDILSLRIASHTRRIYELRQDGWIIEMQDNWTRYEDHSERHTRYRLLGRLSDEAKAL
jgi:Helix-turn-helix domain